MRTRLGIVVLTLAAVAVLTAQDGRSSATPQQPTFRGGANHVRVDMYAHREGSPIEDLTVDEIELLEDGVAQMLESFEYVKVRPAGPQETRIEPSSVSESRQMAGDPRARVFVIFLDTYHTSLEGSAMMREPLVSFIDRVLGPDDLVAVMTPEMAATEITFGRKTTVISGMIRNEWWGRRGRTADNDEKDNLYDSCYSTLGPESAVAAEMKARRREKLTLDALEDLVVHLGGIREERKAVLAVTEGWLLFRQNPRLAAPGDRGPAAPPFLRPPRSSPTERGTLTPSSEIECEADRLALAMVDHDRKLRDIGEDANRGNVTFYPVYARGLVAFDAPIGPDPPPSLQQDATSLRTRQDSLRTIAVDTDGAAIINSNNIDQMLRRIVDDLSSYYLLGYYSSNTKLDGRFRAITVRVKRPGVRVRARRGYRGLTPDALITSSVAASDLAENPVASALNAVAGVNARAQFRMRAAAWPAADPEQDVAGTFWIVGELDYRTRRELVWTAGASADVTVVAADGRSVITRTLEIPSSAGDFMLRVPETGGVAAGEYAVRVRLRPKADADAAVSDIARVIVPATASVLGEAVLWRRGLSTGPQHIRTADPRFLRNERIRLELPASAPGSPTTRLLDRSGKPLPIPLQASDRPDESGTFRWIVIDSALAPLAAGDYAIEVTLNGATQLTAFRVVP